MKCSIHVLLLLLVQTAFSQNNLNTQQRDSSQLSFRASIHKGFAFPNLVGGDQRDENFLLTLGVAQRPLPWWAPSIHLYLSYAEYSYNKSGLSGEIRDTRSVGFYPSLRIAQSLLLGFGYSFGEKHTKDWYAGRADTVTFDGKYSKWSFIVAIEADIYVYRDFYVTLGLYSKEPIGFFALGIARKF